MDVNSRDIAAMRAEGDLPAYLRYMGNLRYTPRRKEEQIMCPHCGAMPGEKCSTHRGKHLTGGIHQARLEDPGRASPARPVGAWPVERGKTVSCDAQSVGVILRDSSGRFLIFDRATPPIGAAPVAGHIDQHGSAEDAARAEVREEAGLEAPWLRQVHRGWRDNRCRRQKGMLCGHTWTVFTARVQGEAAPSSRETRRVRWVARNELQDLASRTLAWGRGHLDQEEFAASPGLEPVWVAILADLGVIRVGQEERRLVHHLYTRKNDEGETRGEQKRR